MAFITANFLSAALLREFIDMQPIGWDYTITDLNGFLSPSGGLGKPAFQYENAFTSDTNAPSSGYYGGFFFGRHNMGIAGIFVDGNTGINYLAKITPFSLFKPKVHTSANYAYAVAPGGAKK